MAGKRLGVGFIGGGFITSFHIRAFVAVRDADVLGVYDPEPARAESCAALARRLGVGDCRAFPSIPAMVADPAVDAIWVCAPNFTRVETVQQVVETVAGGKGRLVGIACEKPLARNVAEARRVTELVESSGLLHGYLEDMVFMPAVWRGHAVVWARGAANAGRPYLARCSEEHNGPHSPWFWRGELTGGGVTTDMMCHSVETIRYLLTAPGAPRASLVPRRVTGRISCLKWNRPAYARQLRERMGVDFAEAPVEDYASAAIEYEAEDGSRAVGEVSSSWSYVGAGLRHTFELLGPEYSLSINQQNSGAQVFFSRNITGKAGEDLVEKQMAESGLLPLIPEETAAYGYEAEDRHMVQAFLAGRPPLLSFEDGLEVVRLLMAVYMSAERGQTLEFPPEGLDDFVPAVATGAWRP